MPPDRLIAAMNPLRLARRVRRRACDWWRGETTDTFFDLHNLRELNPVLAASGIAPLDQITMGTRQAEDGIAGAARLILACRTVPYIRGRWPVGLTHGTAGGFHEWLTGPGGRELGLTPRAVENVRAAFAAGLGERGKRVFEVREDLRVAFPFGMTPHPHRGLFLRWMLTHGAMDLGLTPEEALWFLFERDELPDRGLVATYLVRPDWQEVVPHGLTVFGWPDLVRHLRTAYGLRGRWLDRAVLDSPYRPWDQWVMFRQACPDLTATLPQELDAEAILRWLDQHSDRVRPSDAWRVGLREDFSSGLAAQRGVNVVAHFRYMSGLQEAATAVVRGLTGSGIRTSRRDMPVHFDCEWRDRERYQGVERFDTTIYVAATNTLPAKWYPLCGLRPRTGVRRIALWYWELEELPPEWISDLQWPDEVWAPTRFVADAFRKHLSVPVVSMLPGVTVPAFTPRPRSYFGLPDNRVLFLFTFDMGSVMERKNPLTLIRAFRAAFRPDDHAHLAVKVARGAIDPVNLALLRTAALESGVTLLEGVLPREDVLALLDVADCYVSLHRSEGLGLGMAESMLLGKPVIGTAYSGNLDFMTPDVAHLVEYQRVAIEEEATEHRPYPKGSHWAEPSIEHAAALMRAVFDRPDDARALGDRARQYVEQVLSPAAAARRMMARLETLGVVPRCG